MKKVFTILTVVLLTASVFAQAPEKMSYQAVIRNSSDVLVTNTLIGMEINIHQGTPAGTIVYTETQTPTTNANGLVSIEIGGGASFNTINWASDDFFIETKTALVPPLTTYTITGVSQLLSVPYALHAKTAGSTSGHYVGELYGGGIVFWVDQTGQHGLIVSMVDLSIAQVWSNNDAILIGTTNDWDGVTNTTAIIGQGGHTSSAAKLCNDYINADYGTGTYSDWYLPSIAELNHVWHSFYEVQKALSNDGNGATTPLIRTYYWSSSEYNGDTVWGFHVNYGDADRYGKGLPYYVRAIRAF